MIKKRIYSLVFCAVFISLISVGAFIRIPVPSIPFTMQLFFVTLSGLVLGGKLALISNCLYLFMGLIGIPIFANGGGIGYIFKPSFGYIIGFCIGAFVTGIMAEKRSNPSYRRLLFASFCGFFIVYFFGLVYYYLISYFYLKNFAGFFPLILHGFLMTCPGDIACTFFAAFIAERLIPVIKNLNNVKKS